MLVPFTPLEGSDRRGTGLHSRAGTAGDVTSTWGTVDFGWRWLLFAFLLWWAMLRRWEANGTLDRWNASRALGFVLMVRTSRGLGVLEKVAKPRKFWRAYGEVATWVCVSTMLLAGLLVVLSFVLTVTQGTATDPPPPSELVAIPGLNPVIPLGWGALAFIVALVIHEFGHGLLARGHGMRVRAFGLLQLGPLPLGAFAEPQSEELLQAPRRERLRMFAAGPATNIFAAMILLLLLGGLASQFAAAEEGVHIRGVVVGTGAEEAGLEPWDRIVAIDDVAIVDDSSFTEALSTLQAGETVTLTLVNLEGETRTAEAWLSDKREHYAEDGWTEAQLDANGIESGDAFLGVQQVADGTIGIDRLAGPLSPNVEAGLAQRLVATPIHALRLIFVPFELQGVAMHPVEEGFLEEGDGIVASILGVDGMLIFVNLFFWLIWVNLLLGFTNLIPMVPFDGGHMFRDVTHGFLDGFARLGKRLNLWTISGLRTAHMASKATGLTSLGFFGMLVLMIALPYLL